MRLRPLGSLVLVVGSLGGCSEQPKPPSPNAPTNVHQLTREERDELERLLRPRLEEMRELERTAKPVDTTKTDPATVVRQFQKDYEGISSPFGKLDVSTVRFVPSSSLECEYVDEANVRTKLRTEVRVDRKGRFHFAEPEDVR